MSGHPELPPEIVQKLDRARRLEWWTLFFLATIVVLMYLVLGSSQAMKTAWIEDMLSLLPPALFLASAHIERRQPTRRFPYGFHRVGSLAFFVAACALTAMGAFLLYEAVSTLVMAEHPTIGTVGIFGREVWLGWLMMAALTYSVIPPVILGRMKKAIAPDINDKILFTDADMNAADWQTGLAGIAGIAGIAWGYWWADAAAAGLISFSILRDGLGNCRTAFAELIDGAPRALDGPGLSTSVEAMRNALERRYPGHTVQTRETGRYVRAVLVPRDKPLLDSESGHHLLENEGWRLIEVSRAIDASSERPTGHGRPQ